MRWCCLPAASHRPRRLRPRHRRRYRRHGARDAGPGDHRGVLDTRRARGAGRADCAVPGSARRPDPRRIGQLPGGTRRGQLAAAEPGPQGRRAGCSCPEGRPRTGHARAGTVSDRRRHDVPADRLDAPARRAFTSDQATVLDAVQRLRAQAAAGRQPQVHAAADGRDEDRRQQDHHRGQAGRADRHLRAAVQPAGRLHDPAAGAAPAPGR